MKKKLIISLVCALCCVLFIAGFTVLAETPGKTEPPVIKGHTLALQSNLNLVYFVKEPEIPSGAEHGILFWLDPDRERFSYGREDFKVNVAEEEPYTDPATGEVYQRYYFSGLAAKQMTDYVYAVPFIRYSDGSLLFGETDRYSVLDYLHKYLNAPDTDEDLLNLLKTIQAYGAESQNYFMYNLSRSVDLAYVKVTLVGGKFSDGFSQSLCLAGVDILNAVPDAPEEGYAFAGWDDGTTVTNYIVPFRDATYTATYVSTTVHVTLENGTFENGSSSGDFVPGTQVTLIPDTAPGGQKFFGWRVTAGDAPLNCTLTVPEEDVVCTAYYDSANWSLSMVNGGYAVTGYASSAPKTLEIPSTYLGKPVTEIGENAFNSYKEIKTLVLPDSVTTIADRAFYSCDSMMTVTLGTGLTSIGTEAFSACTHIVEVYNRSALPIAAGSSGYGDVARSAKNVYTPTSGESKLSWKDDFLLYRDGTKVTVLDYCGSAASPVLPNEVTAIGYRAFYNNSGLKSVTLSESITVVEAEAFMNASVKEVVANGVQLIGNSAFQNCASLYRVELPASLSIIGSAAFNGCASLYEIYYASTVDAWKNIQFGSDWDYNTGDYFINCKAEH